MVSYTLKASVLGCLLASVGVEATTERNVWSYISCFSNRSPATGRTLGYLTEVAAGAAGMTVKGCQDVCLASGFSLAGLARSNECYCDNDIRHGRPANGGDSSCDLPCTGNSKEKCGGANFLNLYVYGNSPTSTCAITATSTVVIPTTLTVPGAGEVTTVTIPTTVTLPGEVSVTTFTLPTTLTIPGAGEVTTVTIPTTVTLPGEEEIITVTVPTTVTLPGDVSVTTFTEPTTITVPGPGETTTLTVPGPGEVTTVTLPGDEITVTQTTTVAPTSTCTVSQAVLNSGFETGQITTGIWTTSRAVNVAAITFVVGNPNSGSRALQIFGASPNWAARVRQAVPVCAGQRYIFNGFAKTTGAVNNCQMWFDIGGAKIGTNFTPNAFDFTSISGLVTIPADVTTIDLGLNLQCITSGSANKAVFDDITLTLL